MQVLCCKCLLVCCVQAKHRARWPHVSAFCPLERVCISEFERANKYDEEVPRKDVEKLVGGSDSTPLCLWLAADVCFCWTARTAPLVLVGLPGSVPCQAAQTAALALWAGLTIGPCHAA